MRITVVLPTRGRPDGLAAAVASFETTSTLDATRLVVVTDDDDPALDGYRQYFSWQPDPRVTHVTGPRVRMCNTLNREAVRIADQCDVIGFVGDDHRFRTPGWDEVVSDALRDQHGVAYGDDKLHGAALPTAVFVSAPLVAALGYMAPPGLVHLYMDNFWNDLGRATRLVYRPDVVIEHMHPIAGKGEWDDGYRECNSGAVTEHDAAEYRRYVREEWPGVLARGLPLAPEVPA